MPPKVSLQRVLEWGQLFSLPFRIVQVTTITVLTFIFRFLFKRAEKVLPPRCHDPHAHDYCPPGVNAAGIPDSRSPCPALNTLANHGYLPRDGRRILPYQFIAALQEGYNLSYPLAAFLTWGGFVLLRQWTHVSLADFARHGYIEHDASLGHGDAKGGEEYAPTWAEEAYVQRLMKESADGAGLRTADIARARVRREAEYAAPLDGLHAEIARGEMGLVLGLFGRPVPARPSSRPSSRSPSPSPHASPAHSREPSNDNDNARLSASTSGFSLSSSQSTLVDLAPPSPPQKPQPLAALLHTLQQPETELALPLLLLHDWWTRERLPPPAVWTRGKELRFTEVATLSLRIKKEMADIRRRGGD